MNAAVGCPGEGCDFTCASHDELVAHCATVHFEESEENNNNPFVVSWDVFSSMAEFQVYCSFSLH